MTGKKDIEEVLLAGVKKIYKGGFDYSKNGIIYAQENFNIYKDTRNYSLSFVSELHSRTATGELLRILVDYKINSKWIPQNIKIQKFLGDKESTETYEYDNQSNAIMYTFTREKRKNQAKLTSNPNFHITTPTSVTSFLFVLSKKFDTTARNDYGVIYCNNQWKFLGPPKSKTVSMERVNVTSETLIVNDQELNAFQYKLYSTEDLQSKKNKGLPPPFITVYLSHHLAIPYLIEGEDGTKVQINFLNVLDEK